MGQLGGDGGRDRLADGEEGRAPGHFQQRQPLFSGPLDGGVHVAVVLRGYPLDPRRPRPAAGAVDGSPHVVGVLRRAQHRGGRGHGSGEPRMARENRTTVPELLLRPAAFLSRAPARATIMSIGRRRGGSSSRFSTPGSSGYSSLSDSSNSAPSNPRRRRSLKSALKTASSTSRSIPELPGPKNHRQSNHGPSACPSARKNSSSAARI